MAKTESVAYFLHWKFLFIKQYKKPSIYETIFYSFFLIVISNKEIFLFICFLSFAKPASHICSTAYL